MSEISKKTDSSESVLVLLDLSVSMNWNALFYFKLADFNSFEAELLAKISSNVYVGRKKETEIKVPGRWEVFTLN